MTAMGQYGDAAVLATQYYLQGKQRSPRDAWNSAIKEFSASEESRRKVCPRDAYLGLCQAGLVSGIPAGKYLPRANVNRRYAVNACEILRSDPTLLTNKKALWKGIKEPRAKKENGQLDVVVGMWSAGLLH
jgi:hypothetical protein